jgi:DDE superfamily endonuclease
LRLVFVDECGFAPSQPVRYTWVRPGERKRIPSENPQGRRLNVLAALVPDGPYAALYWVPFPGTFRADQLVRLCEELPPVPVPTVVVLDNASIHTSHIVGAARPALRARRTFLYSLPPYSPDLNDIERLFRTIKYDDLPARRYPTVPLLDAAVRQAFTTAEERLLAKRSMPAQPQQQPRRAA